MRYSSTPPIQQSLKASNAHAIEATIPMAFGIARLSIASPFFVVVLEAVAVALELEKEDDSIVLVWLPPLASIFLMLLSSFNKTSLLYTSVGEVLFIVIAAAAALYAASVSDEPSSLGLMTITCPSWQCELYV